VLSRNRLYGSILPAFKDFTSLRYMHLDDNQFTGGIPDISGLTNLVILNLQRNSLTGAIPASLSRLSELWTLYLGHNQLSGTIPDIFGPLTKLCDLVFERNKLLGPIPTSIGLLTELSFLYLNNNRLSGTIPDLFTTLTNINLMYLGNNLLTGTIPDFSSLSNMWFLDLSYNGLSGPIPSSIGTLSELRSLELKWNSLTGPIPYALQSLTNLIYLDFFSNQLSGTIPNWLTSFSILIVLDLSYNSLTGTIPSSVGSLSVLQGLSFAHNQLYGSIPEALTSLTKLSKFDLSHNYLTGGVVKPMQAYADLSFNYLSSPIRECTTGNYEANCIAVTGACLAQMRPDSVCNSFCGISGTSAACAGHGVCYPTGASLRPACACDEGFKVVDGLTCVPEDQDEGYSFTNTIVPPQTELTKGTRQETAGKFSEDPVMLFLYEQGREDPGCGTELAFNVNFTFSLLPKPGKAGANGFAFVISAKNRPGNSSSGGVGYGGMESRSMAIEFDTFQDPKNGDPDYQHIGLNVQGRDASLATAKAPFVLNDRKQYTAWVDYEPGDPGTIQVFLANSTAKLGAAVLERRFSLCEVLQPGPPQVEQGEEAQLQAYYMGFVASTTVAPFQKHVVLDSWVHAGLPPPHKPVNIIPAYGLNVSVETYAPQQASPFPRYVSADYRVAADKKDSWRFSDYHSWDSVPFLGWPVKDQTTCNACWAYAVVASIEAAYGIATRQEAPRLSVDSLFTLMGLTTAADRCSAGGSPTEAFEKLRALPKDGLVLAGTSASQTNKDAVSKGVGLSNPSPPHSPHSSPHFPAFSSSFPPFFPLIPPLFSLNPPPFSPSFPPLLPLTSPTAPPHFPSCSFSLPPLLPLISPPAPSHFPHCSPSFPLLLLLTSPTAPPHFPSCSCSLPPLLPFISPPAPSHFPHCSPSFPLLLLLTSPTAPLHFPSSSLSFPPLLLSSPPLLPLISPLAPLISPPPPSHFPPCSSHLSPSSLSFPPLLLSSLPLLPLISPLAPLISPPLPLISPLAASHFHPCSLSLPCFPLISLLHPFISQPKPLFSPPCSPSFPPLLPLFFPPCSPSFSSQLWHSPTALPSFSSSLPYRVDPLQNTAPHSLPSILPSTLSHRHALISHPPSFQGHLTSHEIPLAPSVPAHTAAAAAFAGAASAATPSVPSFAPTGPSICGANVAAAPTRSWSWDDLARTAAGAWAATAEPRASEPCCGLTAERAHECASRRRCSMPGLSRWVHTIEAAMSAVDWGASRV
ncbi:unnamed protein product, partial [Closterium sp. Naga37s-1]